MAWLGAGFNAFDSYQTKRKNIIRKVMKWQETPNSTNIVILIDIQDQGTFYRRFKFFRKFPTDLSESQRKNAPITSI